MCLALVHGWLSVRPRARDESRAPVCVIIERNHSQSQARGVSVCNECVQRKQESARQQCLRLSSIMCRHAHARGSAFAIADSMRPPTARCAHYPSACIILAANAQALVAARTTRTPSLSLLAATTPARGNGTLKASGRPRPRMRRPCKSFTMVRQSTRKLRLPTHRLACRVMKQSHRPPEVHARAHTEAQATVRSRGRRIRGSPRSRWPRH